MPRSYPIALQLYSVRSEAEKDFFAVLEKVARIGYQGVEFAGLHGFSPKEVKAKIDSLGLQAAASHGPIPTRENVAELVDTAGILGLKWHVISGGLGPEAFADEDALQKTIEALRIGVDLMQGTGLRVAVHNHWWEFDKQFGGKTPHERMMDAVPELFAEIDTYWTQIGGCAPEKVLEQLGPRAGLLHVKDGPLNRDLPHTALGAGKMDWATVLGAANAATDWLIVELDSCGTDMLEAVEQSYRFLAENGYASCKA